MITIEKLKILEEKIEKTFYIKLRESQRKEDIIQYWDLEIYKAFIKYFNDIDEISIDNFFIGSNFSYGWMPTMFHLKVKEIDNVLKILNTVKNNNNAIDANNINVLKEAINNSLVGASKLLHFINPEIYPILDSKICQHLTNNTNKIDNVQFYTEYQKLCFDIISKVEFNSIATSLIQKIYPMTKCRAFEFIIYNEQSKK